MIPIKLSLSGFLSYQNPATLNFADFDVACISGSNGAGKSSLLDAITWCLFGQARKKDESIINLACQKAEVTLDFYYEGNTYRVNRTNTRGKGGTVDFFVLKRESDEWAAISERTIRDTDSLISRTLKVDYDTFVNASFFLQGKADMFATQRPSDRKKILGNILGLDIWETYRDQAVKERKTLEIDLGRVDNRLAEIASELEEEPARISHLNEVTSQKIKMESQLKTMQEIKSSAEKLTSANKEQKNTLRILEEQIERDETEIKNLDKKKGERESRLINFQQQLVNSEEVKTQYQEWRSLREKLTSLDELARQFNDLKNQLNTINHDIEIKKTGFENKLIAIKEQEDKLITNEATLPELISKAAEAEHEIYNMQEEINQRDDLEQDLRAQRDYRSNLEAINATLFSEANKLRTRIDTLSVSEEAKCPMCDQDLSEQDRQALIRSLEEEGQQIKTKYLENKTSIEESKLKENNLEQKLKNLRELENKLNTRTRELDSYQIQIKNIQSERFAFDNDQKKKMEQIKLILETKNFSLEEREKIVKVTKKIESLSYDERTHDNVRNQEGQLQEIEQKFLAMQTAEISIPPLESEVESYSERKKQIEKGLNKKRDQRDKLASVITKSEGQIPNMEILENELSNTQIEFNRLSEELGSAKQKVTILKDLRTNQKRFKEEKTSLATEIEEIKILEKSFGKEGVPALLIEQAIPEIESQANIILGRLSNNTMTIRLATQRDYKDIKREDKKETLDINISDGSGERDYELYSGGEAFRVNFAIRLALSRVLSQRSGARLQTLVIDEGFGNQDAQGIQRLVETINLVKQDFKKILVITHMEELKDQFPSRIEIEKTDRGSQIKVTY